MHIHFYQAVSPSEFKGAKNDKPGICKPHLVTGWKNAPFTLHRPGLFSLPERVFVHCTLSSGSFHSRHVSTRVFPHVAHVLKNVSWGLSALLEKRSWVICYQGGSLYPAVGTVLQREPCLLSLKKTPFHQRTPSTPPRPTHSGLQAAQNSSCCMGRKSLLLHT